MFPLRVRDPRRWPSRTRLDFSRGALEYLSGAALKTSEEMTVWRGLTKLAAGSSLTNIEVECGPRVLDRAFLKTQTLERECLRGQPRASHLAGVTRAWIWFAALGRWRGQSYLRQWDMLRAHRGACRRARVRANDWRMWDARGRRANAIRRSLHPLWAKVVRLWVLGGVWSRESAPPSARPNLARS